MKSWKAFKENVGFRSFRDSKYLEELDEDDEE
jgi:hypothetical protein